jgi:hypothetical protein
MFNQKKEFISTKESMRFLGIIELNTFRIYCKQIITVAYSLLCKYPCKYFLCHFRILNSWLKIELDLMKLKKEAIISLQLQSVEFNNMKVINCYLLFNFENEELANRLD